jgi:AraC family transcriptional regulator, L-rhamnose operon transcriptional activator RhaR
MDPEMTHDHARARCWRVGAGLAGRRGLRRGDVVLLRPGGRHGYEDCRDLRLCNCCFSSELLRGELAWTREDLLPGYLRWTGPYTAPAAAP